MAMICAICASGLGGCGAPPMPEAFGVTMVEETTCIGQGGQIVMGPQGAFCAMGEGI